QDPLGQGIGVLHLVDRFLVLVLCEFVQAPVLQHFGMQEVLVDRGQLVVERLVEELDDLCVAFHGTSPRLLIATTLAPPPGRWRNANRTHCQARARAIGRIQAAWRMPGSPTTLPRCGCNSARACSSVSVAASTQLPQQAPQPVRIVSSAIPPQPAWAAWRMSRSVTPLQMHTYMERRTTAAGTTVLSRRMRMIVNHYRSWPGGPYPRWPPCPDRCRGDGCNRASSPGWELGMACCPATRRANGARWRSALA